MRHIRKLGSLVLADESTGAVDVKTGSDLLDQAGRVQIPREVLQRLALKGNRVRIEVEDGKILLIPPEN